MSAPPIKEQTLLMGPRKSLVGVLTPAAPDRARPDRPTVVLLNSGIVHRVGANRFSVTLARALAADGSTVVRFDLSGIGDSEPRTDGLAPLEGALADIREALDFLETTRQSRRFILGGLCSGADHSVIYAGADPRVAGIVLLDPSTPRTFRHYVLHYQARMLRMDSWVNLARGKNPVWRAIKARVAGDVEPAGDARQPRLDSPQVRAYLERAYRAALDGGVQMLAVLSGENRYYREQLIDAFPGVPFGDRLRLEFFKGTDHMFTAPAASEKLVRVIVEWIGAATFAAPPDAASGDREDDREEGFL